MAKHYYLDKNKMRNADLSIKDLSKALGMPQPYLSRIANGATLTERSTYFNKLEDLLTCVGEPKAEPMVDLELRHKVLTNKINKEII